MIAVLDELGLTGLATSITGLSAVGAAAILAETGEPGRVSPPGGRWSSTPAGAPAKGIRHLHRPDPHHQAGPAGAAAGRLAGGLGRAEIQCRLRSPVRAPDQPRAQQAVHRASPRRSRRGAAPPAPRGHYHRPAMGSRHRRWRQGSPAGHCRLTRTRGDLSNQQPGRAPRGIATQARDLAGNPGQPRPSPRKTITRCRAQSP
jgi:hypothetical protein